MTITGDEIRAARERAGLTQEQLAQRLRVSMRTVGNWERGATVPLNRLAALREFLRPEREEDEPGLRSASDAELLAEIARRFARGKEGHDETPIVGDRRGAVSVVDVSGQADRVRLPRADQVDPTAGP